MGRARFRAGEAGQAANSLRKALGRMTARLELLAHGASSATRAARFPDDEALEPPAVAALEVLRGRLRSYACVLTSPSRAAHETAAALGLKADVDKALRDCDYGRWRGLLVADVAAQEPDAFAAWRGDPVAAPHGGESLAELIERASAWLDRSLVRGGATLAVTHASVVRAAIVTALGAPPSTFWRIDVPPLWRARLTGADGRWNLAALEALEGRPGRDNL
jgi:broad specificity phosphatase PhoE